MVKLQQHMTKPLVTIAIPAYKKTYLVEAIESALSQTYKNIELIIVDDNSPFDLYSVVKQFDDKRIRYYRNDENLGKQNVVKNWNRCLEYAKGEFFVLLCDDDLLEPDFVCNLLSLAEKYPDCNVFHARRKVLNEQIGEISEDNAWPEWESLNTFYENKLKWIRLHTITEWMLRTSHIASLQYIEFPVAWGSDDISIIKFAEKGGIASSQKVLATFRYNDEHLSKADTRMVEKAKARILNFYWVGEFFHNDKFYPEYMPHLGEMMQNFIVRTNFCDQIRIWAMTPWQAWNFTKRFKVLANILLRRYKHPGCGALGV